MNITITDQPQCKKQLRLEIPGESVRAETDKAAAQLARSVHVPGFRRGKVPAGVIKSRFRKELRDEVLAHLLPHAFDDAVRSRELRVVGEPSLDNLAFRDDETIDVTFTIEVAPEFELADYKGIKLTRRVYKVRDEDIEKTLDQIREGYAELVPVEDRPSQAGDLVTVNMTGRFAPAEAPEGEAEEVRQNDLEIEVGGRGVLPAFTEALTGVRPGDVREFSFTYPADYSSERFAGRTVNYTAEVVAVRVKELPEADDAFAQEVGEKFKTIDELRADIRARLEREAAGRTEGELRAAALEELINRHSFELPQYVVNRQLESRLHGFIRQMAGMGIDPRHLNLDWGEMRESHRQAAERDVRGLFILDKVARSTGLSVSDEEVEQEIARMAEAGGQDPAALKARLTKDDTLDSIREQVLNRKALDLIIESADIQTEEVEGLEAAMDAVPEQAEQTEG